MESIVNFFENTGNIFKKDVYQGPVYIYKITDLKKKLFEENIEENPLNEVSVTKIYEFLNIIPLHINFKSTYSLVGLVTFKGKVSTVCDEFMGNDRKLKHLLELENLNDYCKVVLTEDQNREYLKIINQ